MQYLYFLISFLIVAFGQPAYSTFCGIITSICGYALCWYGMLHFSTFPQRFYYATAFFFAVQLVQTSWFISHPYWYIYAVYSLVALAMGLQFGALSLLVTKERIQKISGILLICSIWTILEWSRLFFLSGFPFNPVGIALSSTLYSMQTASLWGVYGLSFYVIFTNLLSLKVLLWIKDKSKNEIQIKTQIISKPILSSSLLFIVITAPYIYGWAHLKYHQSQMARASIQSHQELNVVLVQPYFPAEQLLEFESRETFITYIINEWNHLLTLLKEHQGKKIDMLIFPEGTVPYGTRYAIFPYEEVKKAFVNILKAPNDNFDRLLDQQHLAMNIANEKGFQKTKNPTPEWVVNNAFWAQALANVFNAEVVIGLEDSDFITHKDKLSYNSAFHFYPFSSSMERYEKRILVPMGEYIPFSFCQSWVAEYGIPGTLTCGNEAKVFTAQLKGSSKALEGGKDKAHLLPFGITICYEEAFGHLMRDNRVKGAEMLVNVTNDIWFPYSTLPQQHFDHARLRTVENGIPLIRACNTGITGVIDSLGRIVAKVDEYEQDRGVDQPKGKSTALYASVPLYSYRTLYTKTGDWAIIGFSFSWSLICALRASRKRLF